MKDEVVERFKVSGYDLMRELGERGEAGFMDWYGPRLGVRVRMVRELTHMTRAELAGCLGYDADWVASIEAGDTLPSYPEAVAMAGSLGVSLSYLLETRPTRVEDRLLEQAVFNRRYAEAAMEACVEREAEADRRAGRMKAEVKRLRAKLAEAEAKTNAPSADGECA